MAKELTVVTNEQIAEFKQRRRQEAIEAAGRDFKFRSMPLTKERREFVLALRERGVSVRQACEAAEVSYTTFMKEVKRNPELAARLDEANDASIEAYEEHLAYIGTHGDINSMATVRALEILVKGSKRYNDRAWRGGKSEFQIETPTGTMSAKLAIPGPD